MRSKLILPLIAVVMLYIIPGAVTFAQQLRAPMLTVEPSRLVFDTTFCRTTKCATMTFRNDGDTVLQVSSVDAIQEPFSGAVPVPFTLLPGESQDVEFCFTPENAPSLDSQVVEYVADTRVSNSFALCFDVTSNMLGQLQPGMTYYDALDSSGKILINSFIDNGRVHDEGAVFWFKESSAFLSVRNFTDNKSSLIAALPDTGFGSDGCIYDALSKTLNGIKSARNQKVVVLVTASSDPGTGVCGPVSKPAVISLANSMDARIFIIGMGSADGTDLGEISQATGGTYYPIQAFDDIIDAFEDITNAISRGVTQSFVLRGEGVAPVLEFAQSSLNFYSVNVGEQVCLPITVRNTGTGPLDIKSVSAVNLPFSTSGTFPGVILPGDEETIDLCFQPAEPGFASASLTITGNACEQTTLSLPIRAVGIDEAWNGHGAVLAMSTNEIAFDTSYCNIMKCSEVSLSNHGDTTVYIRSVESLDVPFTSSLSAPLEIQPGQTQTFDVCYLPPDAPREDDQTASLMVDTRQSISAAMLVDVSASMSNNKTSDGIPFIDAANNAAADFISNFGNSADIQDEAAIYSFESKTGFALLRDYTTSKAALSSALPVTAAGSESCLLDALGRTMEDLAARPNRSILIVITDGFNQSGCDSYTMQEIIDGAIAGGVSIYPVGLGITDTSMLGTIALATGGKVFTTNTSLDAVRLLREVNADLATGNRYTLGMSGRGVSSNIAIDPQELDFGLVRVGLENCMDIEITNSGDAPLVIEPIAFQDPQFVITNPPSDPIMPGTSETVTICFRPLSLREQSAEYEIVHNTCGLDPLALQMQGVAWDNVRIQFSGTYAAKPGSKVQIPITIENRITEQYGITNYKLRLEYNKTLLYPDAEPVVTSGTMSGPLTSVTHSVDYGTDNATFEIELSGGPVTSYAENGTLVKLEFTALLGNAKSTPLNLFVEFEDDNPRTEITQSAVFSIDSICYIDERLIDASGRNETFLKQNAPNPFNPSTTIGYRIAEPCIAKMEVYNRLGEPVRLLFERYHERGDYTVDFTGNGLESGLYFYRLTTPGMTLTRKMLLLK